MITVAGPGSTRVVVEPLRWTPRGRVQVRERSFAADGRTQRGAVYSVDISALVHCDGGRALARALGALSRETTCPRN